MTHFQIELVEELLCLVDHKNNFTPFCVDFTRGAVGFRQKRVGGSNELLYKAAGRKKGLKILDACAGWGTDSFILASLGDEVVALEKNETVFTLLEDGLNRARLHDATKEAALRMKVLNTDFFEYAKNCNEVFDMIYLDPMFPGKANDALPKKEMQILQSIVGNEKCDVEKMLTVALEMKASRVVVKRPPHAREFKIPRSSVIQGKSVRYDVYLQSKLPQPNF